jgi:hypothetical protein
MLLQEIRDGAVDSNNDITTVLRKCLLLAAKLGHDGFRQWVEQELNGYQGKIEDLPPYRLLHVESLGVFVGSFGRQLNNAPIPTGLVPEELREFVARVPLVDPIASLVALAENEGGKELNAPWPADLTALVSDKFYDGMNLIKAWRVVSRNSIVGVVDTVRNRVLSFVLEIEKQYPEAGEKVGAGAQPPPERVNQIFNTNIMGGTNIALGASGFSQVGHQVVVGNVASLRKYLGQLGVEKEDLDELETALAKDPKPKDAQRLGTRVAGWIGKMTGKAASGTWEVATGAGADLLATAIRSYYGM